LHRILPKRASSRLADADVHFKEQVVLKHEVATVIRKETGKHFVEDIACHRDAAFKVVDVDGLLARSDTRATNGSWRIV
jgi:hypothetical protein